MSVAFPTIGLDNKPALGQTKSTSCPATTALTIGVGQPAGFAQPEEAPLELAAG